MPTENQVREMIVQAGGEINEIGELPDGSGFAMASFPLPKTHWLYADNGYEPPPMPMRMGTNDPRRESFERMIREAAQFAVRASTMKGKDSDFDPDALVQNMIVGMLGYFSPDGLDGSEEYANPNPIPPIFSNDRPTPQSQAGG